jgi:hypothetical protein
MGKGKGTVPGAKFKAVKFFRPTQMSIAMAEAGIIPAPHIIQDRANAALLRQQHDNRNLRPSVPVYY